MVLAQTVLWCVLHVTCAYSSIVSRQIRLGQSEFFLPPDPAWTLDDVGKHNINEEFAPLTVITLNATAEASAVEAVLSRYKEVDDVWTPSFTKILYIQSAAGRANESQSLELGPEYNVSATILGDRRKNIPTGPYFLNTITGSVYEAYRLYADTDQAFIQSTYQDPDAAHHPLRAAVASAGGLTVAVPSRLYFTPSKDQPLAGLRIAVKDLMDLQGIKTSGGNRAYYDMTTNANQTATSIQKLIQAGAIVVGKTKLAEFAFGAPWVTDNVDYLLPFNPRGDGYNLVSDSSGGSGASVAAYSWLDAALGTDTGGSVRGPSEINGVYGNRPTRGAVSTDGIIPLSPAMDTVGTIARDPLLWIAINKALYSGSFDEYTDYPNQIYLDPTSAEDIESKLKNYPVAAEAVSKFLATLSTVMSAKVTTYSIDETWNKSTPSLFNTTSISSATGNIYFDLTTFEQWTLFGKGFLEQHMASHNGEFPHMLPSILQGWLRANSSIDEKRYQRDLREKAEIVDWASKEFLLPDRDFCSSAVYVYFTLPSSTYKLDVSDDTSNPSIAALLSSIQEQKLQILTQNVTINCNTTLGSEDTCNQSKNALKNATAKHQYSMYPGLLASIADLPDYSLPLGSFDIGQDTFSNSTMKNQSLPLAVNIIAAKGCDWMIGSLIQALYKEGAIKTVRTGSLE